MLKKIRLDGTRTYEIAIATKYIAEMLEAHLDGRSHERSLGCEQGDIEKWDDLVIEHEDGVFEHIQVKRQLTDFSNDPCEKGVKSRGKNKGEPQNLSPLDEAILGLAEWSKNKDYTDINQRLFVIEVPDFTTQIKKGYQISHLQSLCDQHITHTTNAAALQKLSEMDTHVKNAFYWLTTWCEFKDWNHILKTFRRLQIRCSGLEADLNRNTESILSRYFINGITARNKINSYIDENSTYSGAIKPRELLVELQSELRTDKHSWTQYKNNDGSWEIAGTTASLSSNIECPKELIPKFWNSSGRNCLKIVTSQHAINGEQKLSLSIMRFALHLEGTPNATFNELDAWRVQTRNAVSNTLGLSDDDLMSLSWTECNNPFSPSDFRSLKLTKECEAEAELLSLEMYQVTWGKVCKVLTDKISMMTNTNVRDAIEARWATWKVELTSKVNERNLLLKNMLHPKSEGEDIHAELRIGPKTVNIIAEGFKFLLIVSVALNDNDNCWKTIGDGRKINTLALGHWAGPAGGARRARRITDDGIEQLLGQELDAILIMSKVEDSQSDILDTSLSYSDSEKDSLATPKTPILLITNCIKFRRLLENGTIIEIRNYFNQFLTQRSKIREQNILGITNG